MRSLRNRWFSFLDRKGQEHDAEELEATEEQLDEIQSPEVGDSAEIDEGLERDEIQFIPLELVDTNPYQPRKSFNSEELADLADSIAQYGVLQPVVVRPRGERFELIVGERRLRASKLVGLETIPALIRPADEEDTAFLALVENLQRQDLGFFEEAQAYGRLLEEFGLTQAALAERVGKSQSTIANKLRLLRLPEPIKDRIHEANLSERHARALLSLDTPEKQAEVVERVVEKELSVRETDELVKQLAGRDGQPGGKQKFVKVYKDVRIFINSFRQLVRDLREVGIGAKYEQEETDSEIIIQVRIPRVRDGDKGMAESQ